MLMKCRYGGVILIKLYFRLPAYSKLNNQNEVVLLNKLNVVF